MSVLAALSAKFGTRILGVSTFRGDEEAVVAPADWVEVATWLRDAPDAQMNHFIDLTAVDYPEREPQPRFDVILNVRSHVNNKRVRLKTRVNDGQDVPTLVPVWRGANWPEREVYDMFGIRFAGHPDLRRILMYDEFVGFPLRKDYPIEKTQPLIPYRDVDGLEKLPPFGASEGQPWGRVDWPERLAGRDLSATPALAEQNAAPKTATNDVNKAGH